MRDFITPASGRSVDTVQAVLSLKYVFASIVWGTQRLLVLRAVLHSMELFHWIQEPHWRYWVLLFELWTSHNVAWLFVNRDTYHNER